ncbi:Glycosyltransferase involved in cell wall bisynthesis [Lachnospiraceae bacterium XPB1003]|nr:Glycosyltransferase involved in cell wall bisynthesis [Lachnospiraceae bacterium XPB1003]
MGDNNLISVIIPVYQAKANLEACLASVLAQDDTDYEVILVDDGSTDGSSKICDDYAADGRVKVFHTKNSGAAAARNFGVDKASGDLICFIDSDDTVTKDHISYLRMLVNDTGSDIAVGSFEKIFEDKKTEGQKSTSDSIRGTMKDIVAGTKSVYSGVYSDVKKFAEKKLNKEDQEKEDIPENAEALIFYSGNTALEDLLYQRHFMSVPWGMISRRKLWDNVRFPEGTEAEDMGTIYRLFAAADGIVWGGRKTYRYYQRSGSTMYSTGSTRNKAYYRHSREMLIFIKERYPRYYPAALSRHFSTCCQILSEAGSGIGKSLEMHVKKDITLLAPKILKDERCRVQNKSAASLALVSVEALAGSLKMYDKGKRWYLG